MSFSIEDFITFPKEFTSTLLVPGNPLISISYCNSIPDLPILKPGKNNSGEFLFCSDFETRPT